MIISKIEEIVNNRFKVYVDEEFAFVLYKGELSHFHLKENNQVSDEVYEQILQEVVIPRAKKRAMYLLEKMARTESQLRIKLTQNYYPEFAIDTAVNYVKKFGYIGDDNYARSYIMGRMNSKSKKEIYYALQMKGIAKEIIQSALDEVYEGVGEEDVIKKLLAKKRYNPELATDKEKQKVYAFLMRKGFTSDNIRQLL